VFDTRKPKMVLARDLLVIVILQLAALGYGLYSAFEARPVYLAFEGDRFRLVTASNISPEEVLAAPEPLRRFSTTGPKPLGIQLLSADDPEYMASIKLAIEGLHPAFRPSRWLPYDTQIDQAIQKAKPLQLLKEKNAQAAEMLARAIAPLQMDEEDLGFLPLIAGKQGDWVIIVNKKNGMPVATLHIDGW